MPPNSPLFIGLMSGTSMDGVDGVLASFPDHGLPGRTLGAAYLPFPDTLREQLMALQASGSDEIHREALAANALADLYGEVVADLLRQAGVSAAEVSAIGAHGQTVRHRPECGYTRQIGNPALLAECTGIDVIADFRSRDIAAGGQGAPLVPAFHQALFAHHEQLRVLANIGGISNISVLKTDQTVIGFDTGPGNVLLDGWCSRHLKQPFDADGAWAASGTAIPALLEVLLAEPFLQAPAPKSTGRDLFHLAWLDSKLRTLPAIKPVDVQATLATYTAISLADAIEAHADAECAVYVCGGGAFNGHLLASIRRALKERQVIADVQTTDALGVPPSQVEAFAFAWLAHRHSSRMPGNLASVTGAKGPRILGAMYPA